MNGEEARSITTGRLARWARRLAAAKATPLIVIGVGHGDHAGEWVVCIPDEDGAVAILPAALRYAADLVEDGDVELD